MTLNHQAGLATQLYTTLISTIFSLHLDSFLSIYIVDSTDVQSRDSHESNFRDM